LKWIAINNRLSKNSTSSTKFALSNMTNYIWAFLIIDIEQIYGKVVTCRKRAEWRNASKRVAYGGNSCENFYKLSRILER